MKFEIDLMLRIHLGALIDPDGEMDIESKEYFLQVQKYEKAYAFPRYYQRNSFYRYVRLADIEDNFKPYILYCLDLEQVGQFYCCQLQQAFGILNDDKIMVLMKTDSGVCYNLLANYDVIFETLLTGETDYMQANTFYGKVIEQDKVQIAYHSDTGNIDPDDSNNIVYFFSKRDMEDCLKATIEPTSKVFAYLNHDLSERLKTKEALAILNEVFPIDVQEKVNDILVRYR